MPPTLEELGLDKLSVEDRIAVAQALWDSIPEADLGPLTDEQKREIDRRLAEYEANPSCAIPWEEVKERLLARLRP
jgi:putative addiction module component (TIGR02574 family)